MSAISGTRALLGEVCGWQDLNRTPSLEPDVSVPSSPVHRRLPAAIRMLAWEQLRLLPSVQTAEIWMCTRFLMQDERRRHLRDVLSCVDADESVKTFVEWIYGIDNLRLLRWWKSRDGWRSPVEFDGWRSIELKAGSPHVEPFELAIGQLPDDISMDRDVVALHAWCQGVKAEYIAGSESESVKSAHANSIRDGLKKLISSPWYIFAMCAPFMPVQGVLFRGCGYIDTVRRMEHLVVHPYEATLEELEAIFVSPAFAAARDRAKTKRKYGDYLPPRGQWYVGGAAGTLPSMRRGGVWMAERISRGHDAAKKRRRKIRAMEREYGD